MIVASGGPGRLEVSWTAPTPSPARYLVQYQTEHRPDNDVTTFWRDAGTTADVMLSISGLDDGQPYTVRVCSQHADGTPTPTAATCALGQGTPGVANQPPVVGRQLDAVEIGIGQIATIHLGGAFTDADGDALAYGATSSHPSITAAEIAAGSSVVKITGKSAGMARVTVTATDGADASGVTVAQTIEVTVRPDPVNQPPTPPARCPRSPSASTRPTGSRWAARSPTPRATSSSTSRR